MDYVTRQFIVLAKKLRKEVRKSLLELRDAIQDQTKNIHKTDRRDNQSQSTAEIARRIHFEESAERKREADHEKDYAYKIR